MFHEDTDTGNHLILRFLFRTEFMISGLFLRLIGQDVLRFKPLEARIFKEDTARRKRVVFFITNAFVVDASSKCVTEIAYSRSSISMMRLFFTVWSFFYHYISLFARSPLVDAGHDVPSHQ